MQNLPLPQRVTMENWRTKESLPPQRIPYNFFEVPETSLMRHRRPLVQTFRRRIFNNSKIIQHFLQVPRKNKTSIEVLKYAKHLTFDAYF